MVSHCSSSAALAASRCCTPADLLSTCSSCVGIAHTHVEFVLQVDHHSLKWRGDCLVSETFTDVSQVLGSGEGAVVDAMINDIPLQA